jgi:hypothetical protein
MAGRAEMLVARNTRVLAVRLRIDVTANALAKAVFFCADAPVHGFIPLMENKVHVMASHDFRRLYAMFSF